MPPHTFDFDQKLSGNVSQIILYYHVTKQFLSCVIWLLTCFWFQIRIGFGKTIAFAFDEKLTKSVAQVTMKYHVSKDFLSPVL